MQNVSYPDEAYTKLEFCRKNLVKLFNIKFYKSPSCDSRVISSAQTDRRYEVSSSFSWMFCYWGSHAFVRTPTFKVRRVFMAVDGSMCQFSIRDYNIAAVYNRYWKLWWRTRYENGCHEVHSFRSEGQSVLLPAIVYFLSWNPSCVPYTNIHFKNTSPLAVLTAATEVSRFHLHVLSNNIVEFDV